MKIKFIFGIMTVFLYLSACNNNEDKTKTEQPVEEEPTSAVVEEEKAVYPLTGIEAEAEINQRAVAVMINNHPDARPQSGLHKADIVYEVLAEGNITRFLAIFHSEIPDIIGPVRSARDYYVDLSKGFNALYISHGWSPDAREKLESGEVDFLNGLFYDGTLFWRADHRKAPHNSYISAENIAKGAEAENISLNEDVEPFKFLTKEELDSLQGESAKKVVIKYDNSPTWQATYEYNQEEQNYTRYSANEQTVDLESEEPIILDNILVVEMQHEVIDNAGRRGIDLTSGGKAILLQKGIAEEVHWENQDGRIIPVANGESIEFVPGKSWINVVPNIENAYSDHS
ncbi:DUF3048 domain-containing protein [Metabacillus herbersteinensis]|uniref:DUF3048 domain-containing protein n=1 Tax=Metabacillus herbersteinensis TaxID=283816 RepID=A0ABV6GHP4_9BACI